MSLRNVCDSQAFTAPRGDRERIGVYVPSHQLGFARDDQPEPKLMHALLAERARVQVHGPTGSGKTSLIVRTVSHLVGATPADQDHLVVRLEVGYAPRTYDDGAALVTSILEGMLRAIENASHSEDRRRPLVSGLDIDDLRLAVAAETNETPATRSSSVSLTAGAPVVSLNVAHEIQAASRSWTSQTSPFARRRTLIEALESTSAHNVRVLVIIDDTDHFADDTDGAASVRRLYQALYTLDELDIGILVGFHPRFDDDQEVHRIVTRMSMERIAVAALPDTEDRGIATILDGHLAHHQIETKSTDLFDDEGLGILEGLYYDHHQDYRRCLRVARRAAIAAHDHDEATIPAKYVKQAVAETRPTGP